MISIIVPTNRPGSDMSRLLSSVAEHTHQEYELITVRQGDGIADAFNRGMVIARGEWFVLLHDDNEVTEGWLGEFPKGYGVGAFRVREMKHGWEGWGGDFDPDGYHTDPTAPTGYSAFLMMHASVPAEAGLMDPAYRSAGYYDADYGRTLAKAGYRIQCLDGLVLHHHYREGELQNGEYYRAKWGL